MSNAIKKVASSVNLKNQLPKIAKTMIASSYTPTKKEKELITQLHSKARKKKSNIKHRYNINVNINLNINQQFKSKASVKRYVKDLVDFTNRNNKKFSYIKNKQGVVIPRDLFMEIKAEAKSQYNMRMKDWKKHFGKYFYDGKSLVGEISKTGFIDEIFDDFIPKKFDIDNYSSLDAIKSKLKVLSKQNNWQEFEARKERYKDSYIKSIFNIFDTDKAGVLINLVSQINPEQFNDLYFENMIAHINWQYTVEDYDKKFNEAYEYFNGIVNGN